MKKLSLFAIAALLLLGVVSCSKYETVKGDPMKVKIYTLDNGLKVYMSVNKEQPRLQTYIAVRNGGKNDPSDNTGLAHYLEHIMFKGSESFGTSDYAAEKPLLDQIEEQFNIYRTKTDPQERLAIYHIIDSLSYAASEIAIPNEYDKLMSMIGSTGTNAFTSDDQTVYQENIPSNQIDSWARIQADRFRNLVIRGFHTELEAVYEEYNMYLNEDAENAIYAMDSVLYKHHPYGSQQVIGTQEHLKNPSISAIKKQKSTMYVPNNIAICVSGDFDPDEFVAIIEKYFGTWEPNPSIPEFKYEPEDVLTSAVERHVYGNEADFLLFGWRTPGEKDIESEIGSIVSSILTNGKAGLIDLDLNQQQKVLYAGSQLYDRIDYSDFLIQGYPKDGQTLDEVRALVLAEVAKLRSGDFDESLIEAAIANIKLSKMRQLESNSSRAMMMVNSFIKKTDWADEVHVLDRLAKITKADVVEWANKYLGENSYVVVYKHQGINPKNNKIIAPAITPIATNRDKQSAFLTEISEIEVTPIEPVFVDFEKDMSKSEFSKDIEMLYKKNENNDIVNVTFRFDIGLSTNPALGLAFDYLSYLGTPTRSAEEIALEEYKIAGNHNFSVGENTMTFSVNGLAENLGQMLDIVEDLILNAVPDEKILENLKQDELMSRQMSKTNQNVCSRVLNGYIMYGPEYVKSIKLSSEQLMALTSDDLLSAVKEILNKQHIVLFYGPQEEAQAKTVIAEHHKYSDNPEKLVRMYTRKQIVSEPVVYIAPYDSRQFNYIQYSDRGEKFSMEDVPAIELFNEYFGGGMNTIVFQEMREARALAYSASAYLSSPSYIDDTYCFYARIGSQNDKLKAAVEAFDLIINDMPQSEKSFQIAKTGLESVLRTSRTTGMSVLNSYLNAKELGLTEPLAKKVYDNLADMTMEDVVACQQKWIKGRTYIYGILGDAKDLDMKYLKTLGTIKQVSLDEIFGYE
ncbi:MAG: insulinase family protein [Bacteroidaceae bacterium]|nr:insulinase family protein [Bacteroidaceae bacterium]